MSIQLTNDCGCCTGIDTETPALIDNPPGLPAIRYRIGDYSQFRESLLARLSSSDLPALSKLTTRNDGDFTIALCESAATMFDVLTFYQERIANENYLRTATERGSILELARLIGYTPLPGVAASTHLAFTLQESPGVPTQAAGPVTIPIGMRVQSVPGQDEQPQTFETIEAVEARVEWNAISVQTTVPWIPKLGDTALWLDGVVNQIQAGDVVLIVSEKPTLTWDIRLLIGVDLDRDSNRTRLGWSTPLDDKYTDQLNINVYVFRQRAALFGHNAPDPQLINTLTTKITSNFPPLPPGITTEIIESPQLKGKLTSDRLEWDKFEVSHDVIDLDTAYSKIVPESWFALVSNNLSITSKSGLQGDIELCRATQVAFPSLKQFGLTGKTTQIKTDKKTTVEFKRRETLVLAQSELLPIAQRPLFYPLYGNNITLASLHPELAPGRIVAVYGKRQRVLILPGTELVLDVENEKVTLHEGDSLMLFAAPEKGSGGIIAPDTFGDELANHTSTLIKLKLQDRDGKIGTLTVAASRLRFEKAHKNDPEVSEIVEIDSIPTPDRDRTTLKLKSSLRNCYERATVRINVNVAPATHGETVNEILGSGDARLRNPSFALKQSPLTYVSANTPSGRQSTLEVRVNDLRWKELQTLYQRGSHERVFATMTDAEAHTTVRFGDGIEGGRLPSGDHNIRASYRKGLGLAGNVAAGKLTTLLTRPLGVSGASNPEPATGGADAEKLEDARLNAPLTVKTLKRAVSIQDYRDFARAFAGVAKAHALLINIGPARGIFLTVAGEDRKQDFPVTSDGYLYKALRDNGDPLIPIRIVNYRAASFHVRASIKVAADADNAIVLPVVEAALRTAFGFEQRELGQSITVDQVLSVIQNVGGVEASYLHEFYRSDTPPKTGSKVTTPLVAALPVASYTDIPMGAELLTLDSSPLTLELMT
jgi:hypothetical protein